MSNKDHLDDLSLDADMSEGIKGGVDTTVPTKTKATAPMTPKTGTLPTAKPTAKPTKTGG